MGMRVEDSFRLALGALSAHKLRTVLTLLGLVIGVTSLIVVMTLIQGANTYVETKIANLGTNMFQVSKFPLVPSDLDEISRSRRNKDITRDDMRAVAEQCRSCLAVGAQVETMGRVWSETESTPDVFLRGQTANMAWISTLEVARGRFFTEVEERAGTPLAILGDNVATRLFPYRDPLGRTVRIAGEVFVVVGLAERIGDVLGQEQDTFVIIPLPAFHRLFGARHSLVLQVQARPPMEQTKDEVRHILRARRHVAPSAPDDFYFATADTYLDLYRDISSAIFAVFLLISSVASIVGGIVIMNITLVSVNERTREIGLRRSVGATQRDIARQFLMEVTAQCLAGGLAGVALGFGVALALRTFTPFPAAVEWWVALLGLGFACLIAVVFGIYPAMRAARLDPVVALRHE